MVKALWKDRGWSFRFQRQEASENSSSGRHMRLWEAPNFMWKGRATRNQRAIMISICTIQPIAADIFSSSCVKAGETELRSVDEAYERSACSGFQELEITVLRMECSYSEHGLIGMIETSSSTKRRWRSWSCSSLLINWSANADNVVCEIWCNSENFWSSVSWADSSCSAFCLAWVSWDMSSKLDISSWTFLFSIFFFNSAILAFRLRISLIFW